MGPWWLAWRYVRHHWARSLTLVACVSLVTFLPVLLSWLTATFERELVERAESTPLIVGRKGSRYDLVLESLYLQGKGNETIPASEVDRVTASGDVRAIPLFLKHRAKGAPVVGTTLDYFEHRRLRVASGGQLAQLGDGVVGARVAERLGCEPGDFLLTDAMNAFDIAGQTPLRLRIAGILAPSRSPDDDAIFVDLKTAWIIEGIGHGHDDVARVDPSLLLDQQGSKIRASAGILSYTEITEANIGTFHFHGEPGTFPITSILAIPTDERSMSLLLGSYVDPKETMQIVRPTEVMQELLGFVFRAKRFFDAQSVLVGFATVAMLGLIMVLSARLRQRETETLFKMGAARPTIGRLFLAEWFYIGIAGLVVVTLLALATLPWASWLIKRLLFSS
jgi:putative ABC transport system permease protein